MSTSGLEAGGVEDDEGSRKLAVENRTTLTAAAAPTSVDHARVTGEEDPKKRVAREISSK